MSQQEEKHRRNRNKVIRAKRKAHRRKIKELIRDGEYDSLTDFIIKKVNGFYSYFFER